MSDSDDQKTKRPAFQFYPGDWRKDTALRLCSLAAQGLWINMICIAHECEPYGHLSIHGQPMTPAEIGQMVGISAKQCSKLLEELQARRVLSVTSDGTYFNRRMVRDEDLRNRRASGGAAGAEHGIKGASFGSKGGRPRKDKGGLKNPPSDENQGEEKPSLKPPPSSSSSSSSSPTGFKGAQPDATTSRALGHEAPPIVPSGSPPSAYGIASRAMRDAGCAANPGDPRLRTLVDQGATLDEFRAVAEEAAAKSKGPAWALATLVNRRAEASTVSLAPRSRAAPDDRKSRQLATAAALTGANTFDTITDPETIDVQSRILPA